MSDKPEAQPSSKLLRSMLISAGLLAAFAAVGVGLVALTEQLTRDRIEANRLGAERATLTEIIPPERHDNDLVADTIELEMTGELGLEGSVRIHRARQDGAPVAAVFPVVAPDGYGGPIRLLMGVYVDGSVAGVRVVEHSETPGLGDPIEIERSDWIRDFEGTRLGDPPAEDWTVQRDGGEFDQFTGATITPRAVVRAVKRGLVYFERHQALIFPGEDPTQDDADPPQ